MPETVDINVHHVTRVEGHGDIVVDVQNGEIKNARSFQSQAFIIVGSLIFTGILLAILAAGLLAMWLWTRRRA